MISLSKTIHGCNVDVSQAERMLSDRFLNPQNVVCPPWTGVDNLGRSVCSDSLYLKTAGCHHALDIVTKENYNRPQYSEYITLAGQGIQGNLSTVYGNNAPLSAVQTEQVDAYYRNLDRNTPNFGEQFKANTRPTCGGSYF